MTLYGDIRRQNYFEKSMSLQPFIRADFLKNGHVCY